MSVNNSRKLENFKIVMVGGSSAGLPENPLSTVHGGTGNSVGYIQTGKKNGTTVGTRATIEGSNNTGSGTDSHTEGSNNTASGAGSHAEGSGTKASGTGSHAGGLGTVAGHAYQTAVGKYNNNKSGNLFEVGNGSSSSSKSNAFEVASNGNAVVGGNITAGGTISDANGVLNAVTANPSGSATGSLSKLGIGDTVYDIPSYQNQNVRSAHILSVSENVLRTDIVDTIATGDTLKKKDIVLLKSDRLYTLGSYAYWIVRLYTASSTYIDVVLRDLDTSEWAKSIPAESTLILVLSGTVASETPSIAHVVGCITDDGYVRSGQKSGTTIGSNATAEGTDTTASGSNAHAEGEKTIASAQGAHAEGGYYTSSNTDYPATASGKYAHAEGEGSVASGEASHAEGTSIASGAFAHAEGANTSAIGNFSHSEGHAIAARGEASHVEGYDTNVAVGATAGHAEGYGSSVTEDYAHAEGYGSEASGTAAHAEGTSIASGAFAHAEGGLVRVDDTNYRTTASGDYSHAEGLGSVANGDFSHAEGKLTTAYGDGSHAEGISTRAYLEGAHAEGAAFTIQNTTYMTTANGIGAHAEGRGTTAETNGTHAEGQQTHASAYNAHAEGSLTTASGVSSHAEGVSTTASAMGAHAEGQYSTASGVASHAGGLDTIAEYDYQTAIGKYNSNSSSNVLEVGNGEDDSHRSNALELTSSGYLSVAGKITAGNGGELDFSRTRIYNCVIGSDGTQTGVSNELNANVDNSFTTNKSVCIMFRIGRSSMIYWPSGQNVTLSVNSGTALPIYIGTEQATTDNFRIEKNVTYYAQLANDKWYLSMAILPSELKSMRNELEEVDDALFSDDTTTVDYTNVITLQNAPDVHAQSLKVKFEPIQSGSGDPSPSNVRPISGRTGASAVVSGKNLVEAVLLERGINNDGYVFISSSYDLAYCKVKKGVTYTIKTNDGSNKLVYGLYTNVPTNGELSTVGRAVSNSFTYTATEDCYFAFRMDHGYATPQIEVGSTSTAYVVPQTPQTHTTPFGDTYYSGYVDIVTGELVVNCGFGETSITQVYQRSGNANCDFAIFNLPEGIAYHVSMPNLKCNVGYFNNNVNFDSATTGCILAYDNRKYAIAMPKGYTLAQAQDLFGTIEICDTLINSIQMQLTPQLIKLFKGYNTIYSDAGQVRLEYTANLITCLNEDIAKKADNASLGFVENGNTASRAYTANDIIVWQGQLVKATTSIASGASFTLGTNVVSTSLGELITAILNA